MPVRRGKRLTPMNAFYPYSAKKQVNLLPCPLPGHGVHAWILSAANYCRRAGLSECEAERVIASVMTRPPNPANEVRTAIQKAYRTASQPAGQFTRSAHAPRPPVPLSAISFDPAKLQAFAEKITAPLKWRHWLWERSTKRPDAMNAFSFLAHVFHPGEKVLIFDTLASKSALATLTITMPMDCRVPAPIEAGGQHGAGIWFLCNPVDGQWHDTGERENGEPVLSCRNHQAITAWRHAVLESDQAPPALWFGFIAQLPIRCVAIYTSGSRSIHTLIQLDAASKEAWDEAIGPLKRPLKRLGADDACLSAVRLTRLPQCRRPEKNGYQRLLFLNPNPPLSPLVDLPILASRASTLARWRRECPRWNPAMEAFT